MKKIKLVNVDYVGVVILYLNVFYWQEGWVLKYFKFFNYLVLQFKLLVEFSGLWVGMKKN